MADEENNSPPQSIFGGTVVALPPQVESPGSADGEGPNAVTNIAADGDVVFLVGPDERPIRVHSVVLKMASPTFAAMFKPHWPEGRQLEDELPAEIPLPEDDFRALRTLFSLLHHQNDDLPSVEAVWTPRELFEIAVMADKYFFLRALKFVIPTMMRWSEGERRPLTGQERMYLMGAAFLFKSKEDFTVATLDLIMSWVGSYMDIIPGDGFITLIPWEIFYLLEERRTTLRAELHTMIKEELATLCTDCTDSRSFYNNLSDIEARYEAEISRLPLRDLEETIPHRAANRAAGCAHESHPLYAIQSADLTLEMLTAKRMALLCLDCVLDPEFRHFGSCPSHYHLP